MLGVDKFSSVFGGAPAHTESHYVEHLRAVIRAGYSPVLCKPGTAELACPLTAYQAKRAGEHECGYAHVLDDPLKVGAVVKNWLKTYDGLNVALHLGRSGLAVISAPLAPGYAPTVQTPVNGMGDWWYELPEHTEAIDPNQLQPWAHRYRAGEDHVLVPPAQLNRARYQLVGGTFAAPEWMLR